MMSNIQGYNTMLFHDIYPDYETFKQGNIGNLDNQEYDILGYDNIPEFNSIKDTDPDGNAYVANLRTIYYLLLGRYGNSPIANSDVNQFSVKLFSTIYQYGPKWQIEKQIQHKLQNLNENDIREGSKAIHNHAYNPDSEPNTSSLSELDYINDQNTTNYKKSRIEGYFAQLDLLKDDLDGNFLNKFQKLFLQIARPIHPYYYITEEE